MKNVKIGGLYRHRDNKEFVMVILNIRPSNPDDLSWGYTITYLSRSKVGEAASWFEDGFFSHYKEIE